MSYGRVLLFSPLLLAFLAVGCADPYAGREAVSGKVTLEGQPLQNGVITFVSLDQADTRSGAAISDGKYEIPRANGLKPGNYLVQISAGDGKTPAIKTTTEGKNQAEEEEAAAPGGSTNIVSVDMVPADWNIRSDKKIEIKKGGPNTHDFAIPKKNSRRRR